MRSRDWRVQQAGYFTYRIRICDADRKRCFRDTGARLPMSQCKSPIARRLLPIEITGLDAMNGPNPDPQLASPDPRAPGRAVVPAAPKTSPRDPRKSHDRHAAITDNLNSWHDYKRWAESIRSTWGAAEKLEK